MKAETKAGNTASATQVAKYVTTGGSSVAEDGASVSAIPAQFIKDTIPIRVDPSLEFAISTEIKPEVTETSVNPDVEDKDKEATNIRTHSDFQDMLNDQSEGSVSKHIKKEDINISVSKVQQPEASVSETVETMVPPVVHSHLDVEIVSEDNTALVNYYLLYYLCVLLCLYYCSKILNCMLY